MFCAQCGAQLKPGARFCAECGAVVGAGASPGAPGAGGFAPPGMGGAPGYAGTATAVGVEYAGFWIRLVALIIDSIILGIVSAIISIPLRGSGVGSLIGNVISAGYFVWALSQWDGQTVGARALGIKVVDVNGGLLSPSAALIRWLVGNVASLVFTLGLLAGAPGLLFIGFLVSLGQIVGYLMMLWDPRKQTLHDKAAGSFVIRVSR